MRTVKELRALDGKINDMIAIWGEGEGIRVEFLIKGSG